MCNMQTIRELHRRYNKQLGITFSTMYPGCIAETALFRQKRGWFRTLFPLFMKYACRCVPFRGALNGNSFCELAHTATYSASLGAATRF